jgi:hypothetical protein
MNMPFDENESPAEDAIECLAVIYCTFCGHRSAHAASGCGATTTWRMTPREIRTMRRELPKLRCVYCEGSIEIRVVGDGGGSALG